MSDLELVLSLLTILTAIVLLSLAHDAVTSCRRIAKEPAIPQANRRQEGISEEPLSLTEPVNAGAARTQGGRPLSA